MPRLHKNTKLASISKPSASDFRSFAAAELNNLLDRLTTWHDYELSGVHARNHSPPNFLDDSHARNSATHETRNWMGACLDNPTISDTIRRERSTDQPYTPQSPLTDPVRIFGDMDPEVVTPNAQEDGASTEKKLLVLEDRNAVEGYNHSPRKGRSQASVSSSRARISSDIHTVCTSTSVDSEESEQSRDSFRTRMVPTKGGDKKVRLRINVISASSLRDADTMLGQGVSDPYCICRIRGKSHTEFRTHVVADNLNPVWNHQSVIADFDSGDYLEFIVMDKDTFKQDDILGETGLWSEEFEKKGYNGVLRLDRGGSIRVKIVLELNDHGNVKALLKKSQELWPPLETVTPFGGATSGNSTIANIVNDPFFSSNGRWSRNSGDIRPANSLHNCIFKPSSPSRVLWDMFGLLLVVWDFVIIPYSLVFDLDITDGLLIIIMFIAGFWTLDMITTFCAGIEHHGLLERRFRVIAGRYLKTWFILDLILVSFDWAYVILIFLELSSEVSAGKAFRFVKSARSVRTVRSLSMLRLWKLGSSLGALVSRIRKPVLVAVFQLMEAILILVLMTHLVACIWYGLGTSDNQAMTWLKVDALEDKSTAYLYATSVHWAVTQFTPASSEVMPTNIGERLFTVIVDFLGLIAFSTFVSTITQKMTMIREIRSQEHEQADKLSHFLEQHKISLELGSRLMYFNRQRKVQMDHRLSENQVEVFQELPDILRTELHREMYSRVLSPHPWFKVMLRLDPVGMEELCEYGVSLRITFEDEDIFAYGEIAKFMYFVSYGKYNYIRLGERFRLEEGDWLGEPGLWVDGWVHRGAMVANTHSELLALGIIPFKEAIVRKDASSTLKKFIRSYVAAFVRMPVTMESAVKLSPRTSDDFWDTQYTRNNTDRASLESTNSIKSMKSMSVSRLRDVHHMIQLSDVWGSSEDLMLFVQAAIKAAGLQKSVSRIFTPQETPELPKG